MPQPMKLLMVCSGNICRSPLAEVMSVAIGSELGIPVVARSAGTLGLKRRPADPKSVKVAREIGLDLSGHRSQAITPELLDWADFVLVMELSHGAHLRMHFDPKEDRIMPLGPLIGKPDIPDPIGRWTFHFRRMRKQVDASLRAILPRLQARLNADARNA